MRSGTEAAEFAHEGFARMRTLADAVLYEGYLLYPYRASAGKNQLRWQFGVLAPRGWSEATGLEAWWTRTECLVEPGPAPRLLGRARFLQPEQRRIEALRADGRFEPVERLALGDLVHTGFDEARVREMDFEVEVPAPGARSCHEWPIVHPAASREEPIAGADGAVAGRRVFVSAALSGRLVVDCAWEDAPRPHLRLTLRTENATPGIAAAAPRDVALRAAFVGFHLLLVAEDAAFVSQQDAPAWVADAAPCQCVRAWPVLAGEEGDRGQLLSAPIILSDHPQVAPESPGDLFDATEIDEILSLRTMTLTEEEKREARATDPRAAAIIDRCDALGPERLERLHGAVRSLRPVEQEAPDLFSEGLAADESQWEGWSDPTVPGEGSVEIGGVVVTRGSRVRLRPTRRSDAQDFLLRDRQASVAGVYEDLEGRTYLGVTLDDEPDADLFRGHGRYFYFFPDEVVPLGAPE